MESKSISRIGAAAIAGASGGAFFAIAATELLGTLGLISFGATWGAVYLGLLEWRRTRPPGVSGFTPPQPMPPARGYRPSAEQIAAAGEKVLHEMHERGELPVWKGASLPHK